MSSKSNSVNETNSMKHKIFQIAVALIKKKGYSSVTLNEITEKAGISKNTFYYYFDSKEDLLTSYFKINREISTEVLAEIINLDSNFEILWKILEPPIEFFIDMGPEILKQVMKINLSRDVKTFSAMSPPDKVLEISELEHSLIRKAQKNDEINNKSNPEILTKIIHTTLMGIAFRWSSTNGSFDLKKLSRIALESLLDFKSLEK